MIVHNPICVPEPIIYNFYHDYTKRKNILSIEFSYISLSKQVSLAFIPIPGIVRILRHFNPKSRDTFSTIFGAAGVHLNSYQPRCIISMNSSTIFKKMIDVGVIKDGDDFENLKKSAGFFFVEQTLRDWNIICVRLENSSSEVKIDPIIVEYEPHKIYHGSIHKCNTLISLISNCSSISQFGTSSGLVTNYGTSNSIPKTVRNSNTRIYIGADHINDGFTNNLSFLNLSDSKFDFSSELKDIRKTLQGFPSKFYMLKENNRQRNNYDICFDRDFKSPNELNITYTAVHINRRISNKTIDCS
jgi:hypothetical protein